MLRYFVSYFAPTERGGFSFGNCEVTLQRPITGIEAVRELASSIQTSNDGLTGRDRLVLATV